MGVNPGNRSLAVQEPACRDLLPRDVVENVVNEVR